MDSQRFRLNDKMFYTVGVSPIDYFGSAEKRAMRVLTYFEDRLVSTWDVYLNEDTRFFMSLEVEDEFQGGLWRELLLTYEPGSMAQFDRPYVVWFNAGEWVVNQTDSILNTVTQLNSQRIMQSETVMSVGTINDVFKIE